MNYYVLTIIIIIIIGPVADSLVNLINQRFSPLREAGRNGGCHDTVWEDPVAPQDQSWHPDTNQPEPEHQGLPREPGGGSRNDGGTAGPTQRSPSHCSKDK